METRKQSRTTKTKKELKQLEKSVRQKEREKKGYKKLEGILTNVLNKLAEEDGYFN